jgi:hypothetical protein
VRRLIAAGLAASIIVFASWAPPASGAFVFTTLDNPAAAPGGTVPNDVEGGRVVGTFRDASGDSHGFVFDGATWTPLDHPAAAPPRGTQANGISNGLICGTFVDDSGQTSGFLFDGANWTTLQHPPLGIGRVDTFARGISGDTVVGYYIESVIARGFVYRGGSFTDFVVPGGIGTFPDDVDPARAVGTYDDLVTTHGFVSVGGVPVTLDHPLGLPLGTFLTGVDGRYVIGNYLSLEDGSSHGFVYDGSSFIPLDVPGATDTSLNGIGGTRIVGTYVDAAGETHGFVTTVPEPAAAGTMLLCCAALFARRPRRTTRRGN